MRVDYRELEEAYRAWAEEVSCRQGRKEEFRTDAGIPIKELYTPLDTRDLDYLNDLGFPGQPPFTRGIYPDMYRGKLWTIRLFSGFGTPEETNARWKLLHREGETGFSAACDNLTTLALDPDHFPGIEAEVGKEGVPLYSIRGMEALIEGLPIDEMSVALVVTPMAAPAITTCYLNLADRAGIPRSKLQGTTQSDVVTSSLAIMPWGAVSPEKMLKLPCDLIEYTICRGEVPRWNPVNFTTYNYREGGIDAVQEIALGLAAAVAHIEELLRRGWKVDDFVHRLAFHLSAHRDFFEEIAKYRAARRLWYELLKERYRPENPRAYHFRFHVQTAGSSLTAQQPMVNVIRTAVQALEAMLGGCQSLHTNSYDEAICLPSDEAVTLAVRTQQVLREETGVASVVDPLAGSYYVEHLTARLQEMIRDYLERIEAQGGIIKALQSGWVHAEMAEAFHKRRRDQESGKEKVVGVNCFVQEEEERPPSFRINPEAGRIELERLRRLREERDNALVGRLKDELRRVCERAENVLPVVYELTAAGASLGEIADVYREIWGVWQAPVGV
jgi:methylmalonyl-CoA mutase N-terminal domain/subunit